jgi:enamine deaminase RidA (YjgF/YER057c/UK114 family)
MSRQNILSGSPWEDKMGYCRAVRIGNIIEVAGTVAIVDGEIVKADDAFAQTNNIIERIAKVLEEVGASLTFSFSMTLPARTELTSKMLSQQRVFMRSANWYLLITLSKLNLLLY